MTSKQDPDSASSSTLLRLLALYILTVTPLQAYINPGTGMLIWQLAGAFFLGCGYHARKFLMRIRKRK